MHNLLLCCDLDRTVLPNGNASETPGVRELFARIVKTTGMTLAYVSGRNRHELAQAIDEYHIPVPHFAIGDVGTTLYQIRDNEWLENTDWADHIGKDWQQSHAITLQHYLDDMPELTPQEPEKQTPYKLSFYVPLSISESTLVNAIQRHLDKHQIKANLIYSIDETTDTALLDILPQRASKYHAIEFLIERFGFRKQETLFAGDSGNDMPVLISDIPSVLVNNAQTAVKNTARRLADRQGLARQLYVARGGYHGLNGNYTAGVLEGLAHFHPELRGTLASMLNRN